MKTFEPILEDKPIEYAYNLPKIFRNTAREKAFGSPVYFFPPNYTLEQFGCGGYHYQYGYPYDIKRGYKGNCTYWFGCRYLEVSGITLKEVIDSAKNIFKNYKGRKDGGLNSGMYIGETIQKGDGLVFADNLENTGDGHIVFVEDVEGNTLHISESAYSQKSVYEGKACIVYTLDKNKMVCGKSITLRPQLPYSEYLIGVIHTGDVFDKEKDYKALYEEAQNKLNKIKEIL